MIIASELLEAGRTLEMDYASPERTTLIASTHRLFAIGEKTVPGNGIFPRERLEEAARKLTRRLIGFDALDVARRAGSEVNAVLLGALAAARILPMTPADFEAAIREGGVAVERNLSGFKAGMEVGDGSRCREARRRPWRTESQRAAALGRAGGRLPGAGRSHRGRVSGAPPSRRSAKRREADRLPGRGYAEQFLERVRRVRAADRGAGSPERFARRLAVWMTYEDAIRVADLKTRRSRFERIRREQGAPRAQWSS